MRRRDPEARMAEITAPPRLPPLPDATLTPRALAPIERLSAFHQVKGPPIHDFFQSLSRSPDLLASYLQLGADLSMATTLPGRVRELAILRTGWLCGAPYQWGEHVRVARREGLDDAEIARVREGSMAAGWDEQDRAVLIAVEELHDGAMLDDATWEALVGFLDERQLIELLVLVGHYTMTAFIQNTLRVPLGPANSGLCVPSLAGGE